MNTKGIEKINKNCKKYFYFRIITKLSLLLNFFKI